MRAIATGNGSSHEPLAQTSQARLEPLNIFGKPIPVKITGTAWLVPPKSQMFGLLICVSSSAFIPIGITYGSRGSSQRGAPPERNNTRLTLEGSQILRSLQDRNALHESFSGGVASLNHRLPYVILIRMKARRTGCQRCQPVNTCKSHANSGP